MKRKSKQTRVRRGREYWEKHLHEWEESGQTQAEYCRHKGLNATVFSRWKNQLSREESARESAEFVEVPLAPPEQAQRRKRADSSLIEVTMDENGQFTIRVSPEYYRQLLGLEEGRDFSER